jgi:hypothetical protein
MAPATCIAQIIARIGIILHNHALVNALQTNTGITKHKLALIYLAQLFSTSTIQL